MKKILSSIFFLGILIGLLYLAFVVLPDTRAIAIVKNFNIEGENIGSEKKEPEKPAVVHLPTPEVVKTLYITSCYAADPELRAKLVKIADETEINSLIIDIKDWSGTISFIPEEPEVATVASTEAEGVKKGCVVSDMREFIHELHQKNIYTIARLTVFQDPRYATLYPSQAVQRADGSVWKDKKGIAFVDVSAKPYWDFVVALSKSAYNIGFDEVNFDYIRYPTDGDIREAVYPYSGATIATNPVDGRRKSLKEFFEYLDNQLPDKAPVTSADLFGMTTNAVDDMGIGQYLEDAMAHFDAVAPMVYPSHYPATWNGHQNPNTNPGEVVYDAMKFAVDRANVLIAPTTTPEYLRIRANPEKQLRAWIQDFDYGGDYDAADVRAQIDGTARAGAPSFMIWDPSNRYTPEALKEEPMNTAIN